MAENQATDHKDESSNQPDDSQEWLRELQNVVVHVSDCRNLQCDVVDCRKVKKYLSQMTFSDVREIEDSRICKALWLMFFFHINSCTSSNCAVPSCKEWRENLRNAKESESELNSNEDVRKLRVGVCRDANADSTASARRQQMVQHIEPKPSKGEGLLATGSGSGSGSGLVSVLDSTASQLKIKQQVDLVSNKSQVLAKLKEEQIGSCLCSGSHSGAVAVLSARQLRMKQRVIEGSRKIKSPIQSKKQHEYTDQDKRIMLGLTTVSMHALFRNMKK